LSHKRRVCVYIYGKEKNASVRQEEEREKKSVFDAFTGVFFVVVLLSFSLLAYLLARIFFRILDVSSSLFFSLGSVPLLSIL
jgi:phosphatidylglycerophosphatase A